MSIIDSIGSFFDASFGSEPSDAPTSFEQAPQPAVENIGSGNFGAAASSASADLAQSAWRGITPQFELDAVGSGPGNAVYFGNPDLGLQGPMDYVVGAAGELGSSLLDKYVGSEAYHPTEAGYMDASYPFQPTVSMLRSGYTDLRNELSTIPDTAWYKKGSEVAGAVNFGLDVISDAPTYENMILRGLFDQSLSDPAARGAADTGNDPGVSIKRPGEFSALGINNYSLYAQNWLAKAGSFSLDSSVNRVANPDGSDLTITHVPKFVPSAESLLTDSMFVGESTGEGDPNSLLHSRVAFKYLGEVNADKLVKTAEEYAGMGKESTTLQAVNLQAGAGLEVDWLNPFLPDHRMGLAVSRVYDGAFGEHKLMTGYGATANDETGIYGFSLGTETRNRLAATTTTTNVAFDLGLLSGKASKQDFKPFGPSYGFGGTMSGAWNDNTGTLTLQMTNGGAFGLLQKFGSDYSGELRVPGMSGFVSRFNEPNDMTLPGTIRPDLLRTGK